MSRDHAASSLSPEAKRDLLAQLLRSRAAAPDSTDRTPAPPPVRPPSGIPRLSRTGPRPLSFAQHRLWFFDQLMPQTAIYNIHVGLRLTGTLDVGSLAGGLSEIVRRHEVLRSRFVSEAGTPFQVVTEAQAVSLETTDLRHLPPAARDAESRRLAELEAARPFDLATGPLFRASLLRVGDDAHVLLITMHHIVSDGLSGAIVVRELTALYGRAAAGGNALADLPIQYADFAEWQRSQFGSGDVFDRQLAFWKDRLGGDLPILALPTDFPRGSTQTFRGATAAVILPEPLVQQLKALSREQGATLFMTLLAAFQLLLSRQSGQDDVIVGFPVAGRSHPECEPVIGCFINTLALRTDLGGRPTFVELLGRVRRGALEAYTNQDVPFDKIVEELNPERDRSRTPVFQVLFNMLGAGNAFFTRFGDVAVEPSAALEEPSKFDLTVYAGDIGNTVYLRAVYNADLFTQARIDELVAQFVQVLSQAVATPSMTVADFSLVTPGARAQLPDVTTPLESTWDGFVDERVTQQARRTPDRVAVSHHGTAWTYAELDRLSDDVAGRLASRGIGTEDVVCVYASRSPELVAALLGIWKCGAAFLVLDPSYPAPRLRAYVSAAQPKACLATTPDPSPLREMMAGLDPSCLLELRGKADSGVDQFRPASRRDRHPDQLAYVAFTSGSSGAPKGILGTHRPVSHFLRWHADTFGFGAADRFSMLSGLAHDPLLRDIFTPLWLGASLHIPGEGTFDSGDRLAGWMASEGVTVAHLTPPMAQLLCQSSVEGALPLRHAFLGGEALTTRDVAALRRLAPAVHCVNFYGATETPQAIACCDVDENLLTQPVRPDDRPRVLPIGRGIAGVQLVLLNGADALAGIGELAEICVRTPYLARGYAGATAQDEGPFTINPLTGAAGDRLYRTRDLGRYRPDGMVEWHGRRDAQVKLRGFRIELGEIESVLMEHPAITQAAVLLSKDDSAPQLIAYCVSRGAEPARTELREWLRARLPEYMVPATLVFVASVPRTPNGKIDRRRLPAPGIESAVVPDDAATEWSPVEQALAEVWSGLLRVERIGANANFFDIGGHSLLATQLVSRIRELFGIELPLRRVFDSPTIAGQALAITQSLMDEDEAAEDSSRGGQGVRG